MDFFDKKTRNRYTHKQHKSAHHQPNPTTHGHSKSESFDKLSDRLINKLCKHEHDTRETSAMKSSVKYFVKHECDKVTSQLLEKNPTHEDVSVIFKQLVIRKIYDCIGDDATTNDTNFMKNIVSVIDQLFDLKDIIQLFALSILGNKLPNVHDFLPRFTDNVESLISGRITKYCEDKLIDKDLIDDQIIQVVMNNYLYLLDDYLTNKLSDPTFHENIVGLIDKSIITNFGKD